jgi:hypothetical protein
LSGLHRKSYAAFFDGFSRRLQKRQSGISGIEFFPFGAPVVEELRQQIGMMRHSAN